jgi:hypothetical protein
MYTIDKIRTIQILFDETLLRELDATDEVKKSGRSSVLRRAAREYLSRKRQDAVAESYRQAYGPDGGMGDEFAGWEDEGQWPPE